MDPENLDADQGGQAPEPVIEPADAAPEPEPQAAAGEGAEGQAAEAGAADPEPQPEPAKHKVPQSVQKRIDKLSFESKSNAERAEAAESRIKALEMLLEAGGGEVPKSEPGTVTDADVDKRAAELLAVRTFNEKCDTVWAKGEKDFGEGFKDNVGMLRALGVMQVPFVEAVMETAAPERVLNALGADPDEAVRIASLPPIRQAIALDRMAAKLATPAKPQISKVPAPINTLDGSGKAIPTIYDNDLSDDDYYAIREKEREAHFNARR